MSVFVDKGFEDKVLACMFNVREFAAVATVYVKPSHFTDHIDNNLSKIAIDAYKNYKCLVTDHVFIQTIKKLVEEKKVGEHEVEAYVSRYETIKAADCQDHVFVLEELVTFLKSREWRNLIQEGVTKLLPKNNFDELDRRAQYIQRMTAAHQVDYVKYYDKDRLKQRFDRREQEKVMKVASITTGIAKLDESMYSNGWRQKEFYLIVGDTKAGKTMCCLWFANAAQWAGSNVLYVTHETSIDVLEDRVDAMNACVPIKHVTRENKRVIDHMMQRSPEGSIYFVEYPTSQCTIDDLETLLRQMEMDGIRIDMLVTDYLDIMSLGKIHGDEILHAEKTHYEKFRGICVKWNLAGISPLQVTKGGVGKQVISASDARGNYEKIATADGVLTLAGTDSDRESEEMLVSLSRFRNAAPCTIRIKTDYGHGRFYKEFLKTGL